jgi:hypothetical protein
MSFGLDDVLGLEIDLGMEHASRRRRKKEAEDGQAREDGETDPLLKMLKRLQEAAASAGRQEADGEDEELKREREKRMAYTSHYQTPVLGGGPSPTTRTSPGGVSPSSK